MQRPLQPLFLLAALGVVLALVGGSRLGGNKAAGSVASPQPVPLGVYRPSPAQIPDVAQTSAAPAEWTSRVDAVAQDCGLPVHSHCEGGACVGVAEVPPLNGPLGWLKMAWQSPALVLSVVAGEAGLPDRSLPCRASIRGLADTQILARAATSGEVWCLATGPDDGALCDRAASRYVLDPSGSFEGGVDRIVELRPPP